MICCYPRALRTLCLRTFGRIALCLIAPIVGCSDQAPRKSPSTTAQSQARDDRPNIVMIVADDLRFDFLGCTGHPFIKTPAIDRLAAEGVTFTNSFVITPLCGPSRATMLTGLHTYAHGISNNTEKLAADAPTFVDGLNAAGYETAFIGRYHIGTDSSPKHGFDHWVGFTTVEEGGAGEAYTGSSFNVNGKTEQRDGYSADVLASFASAWIAQRDDKPFFLLLPLKSPHVPFLPPPRYADLYADETVAVPRSYCDPLAGVPGAIRHGRTKPPVSTGRSMRQQVQSVYRSGVDEPAAEMSRRYARMVPAIDDVVGVVRAALEQSGAIDNTVIIVTSDNGIMLGEHGMFGKELAYDPSIRVPLIIRDPRSARRGAITEQVLNIDWAPTVLALAGAEAPAAMHGESIVPLIRGEQAAWRTDWLMLSHDTPNDRRPRFMAVRSIDWKYVRYMPGDEEELFELAVDPQERHNLASDAGAADQISSMRARMKSLLGQWALDPGWMEP